MVAKIAKEEEVKPRPKKRKEPETVGNVGNPENRDDSPFPEQLRKKWKEFLFMYDALEEYMPSSYNEKDGFDTDLVKDAIKETFEWLRLWKDDLRYCFSWECSNCVVEYGHEGPRQCKKCKRYFCDYGLKGHCDNAPEDGGCLGKDDI